MMKLINSLSLLVIFALFVQTYSQTEERMCADENCDGVISIARVTNAYPSAQKDILSLKTNSEVKVKSKSSTSDYWGVEIDGKNGYAPYSFLQELKIQTKAGDLVLGKPRIKPPMKASNKLKGSEKEKSVFESTTTAPLPNDLENEKISIKANEGQDSNEKLVKVTPTAKVIDGTELPPFVTEASVESINNLFPKDIFVSVDDEEDDDDKKDDVVQKIPSKVLPENTTQTEPTNANLSENLPETNKYFANAQQTTNNTANDSGKPDNPVEVIVKSPDAVVDSTQTVQQTSTNADVVAELTQTWQQTLNNTESEGKSSSNNDEDIMKSPDVVAPSIVEQSPINIQSESGNSNNPAEEIVKSLDTVVANSTQTETKINTVSESEKPSNAAEEIVKSPEVVASSDQPLPSDNNLNSETKPMVATDIPEIVSVGNETLGLSITETASEQLKMGEEVVLPKTEGTSKIPEDATVTLNNKPEVANSLADETELDSKEKDEEDIPKSKPKPKVIKKSNGSEVKLLSKVISDPLDFPKENPKVVEQQKIFPKALKYHQHLANLKNQNPSIKDPVIHQTLNNMKAENIAPIHDHYQNTASNIYAQVPSQVAANTVEASVPNAGLPVVQISDTGIPTAPIVSADVPIIETVQTANAELPSLPAAQVNNAANTVDASVPKIAGQPLVQISGTGITAAQISSAGAPIIENVQTANAELPSLPAAQITNATNTVDPLAPKNAGLPLVQVSDTEIPATQIASAGAPIIENVQTANAELPNLPTAQITNDVVPEAQIVDPEVPTNALPQFQPVPNQLENNLGSSPSVNGQSPQTLGNPESDKQSANTASTLTSTKSVLDSTDSIQTAESSTVLPKIAPNPSAAPEYNLNTGNAFFYQGASSTNDLPTPKQIIENTGSSSSSQDPTEGQVAPEPSIAENAQKSDDYVSAKENLPSEIKSEISPPTSNEVPSTNEVINEQSITTNDLKTENEDVTTPLTTTPQFDDSDQNPLEFDVTTPNPKPSYIQPPQVGLFQTILGTVKGFLPSQEPIREVPDINDELDRIFLPKREVQSQQMKYEDDQYCERDANCPTTEAEDSPLQEKFFFDSLSQRVVELFDVLCVMLISAMATLFFIFGYYCLSQCRKESQLIAQLNVVERSLLASHKEACILKHDLGETCDKLASIENNSFGSNDMVIAIKKELEACEEAKSKLEEQVVSLEKELENAAEAGLELNKIVSELLSNQNGDDSIISSVEELQRQLNEQQRTILEINAVLADKSRENSELQLILAEQNAKFVGEIASLQQDNDELEGEKNILKSKIDEMKTEFDLDITKALEGKNAEIKRLQTDIVALRSRCDDEHRKWQTSVAKVEALENCLKSVKRDPNLKISQIIDVANVQAELLDIQRQRSTLKEKLETETDSRKLLEDQVKSFGDEIEKLKQDFNQSEKDKLEAQTRLEVLSNYFKDKENQLQKELSLKETMWLQQQGETISTVDRLTNMQEEIQTLKSQNDSLRAEIEAQLAAHKAQIGTLENRAHETWLAARQSERRYEEARSDATALRRKLTSLVGSNAHNLGKENNLDLNLPPSDLNNVPSPVHMDSPSSPMLGRLPPPPFIPPPFMGPPPPHFMGIPPFMPPGEMRPPPMGRLMSPQPPPASGRMHRYTTIDDDEDEDDIHDNGRGRWRDTYSPPRHSYRYSPDRYIYNPELISNYDTETDFSPPPSPRERSHRSGSRSGSYKAYSPPPPQSSNNQSKDRPKKSNKGQLSSESEKSYDSWKGKSKAMV